MKKITMWGRAHTYDDDVVVLFYKGKRVKSTTWEVLEDLERDDVFQNTTMSEFFDTDIEEDDECYGWDYIFDDFVFDDEDKIYTSGNFELIVLDLEDVIYG